MAGTLTISTLSDGTNSTSSTNCITGSAKAWVNYNGVTTVTVRASYNVSSVTRTSAGVYVINFTNAFTDINYCSSCFVTQPGTGGAFPSLTALPSSTSSFPMQVVNAANSATADASYICVSFFR
jgi:hypothetical protein